MEDNSDKTSTYNEEDKPIKPPDENTSNKTSTYTSENNNTHTYNDDTHLRVFSKTHNISTDSTITLKNKNYLIKEIISEGTGEAVIYKIDDDSGRTYALKLYYEFNNHKEEPNFESLNRISKLDDEDILKLYDFGAGTDKYKGKYCFEISDFAYGGDMLAVQNIKEKYTPEFIEHYVIPEIFKGITSLHKNKVFHCDLKPSNIFFLDLAQQNIVIGDYGSSKAYDLESEKDVRKSSSVKGTEAFIAPEQARGIVTDKNDFYSFGMILLNILYPESLTEDNDFRTISRKKYRMLAERQFSEMPLIEFNPAYERFNNLIEGLTLHNFSNRWSAKEVSLWLKGENPPIIYRTTSHAPIPPIKLGSCTIASAKDLINYIQTNELWFEELIEDTDTYTTFKIWLDAYKDIPTRKIFDELIKWYAPSGLKFVKDAVIRLFKPDTPVVIGMHLFDIFNSKTPEQTLNIIIAQTDEVYKVLPADDVKFIFFQLEFALKQSADLEKDTNRKILLNALIDKIYACLDTKPSLQTHKMELYMLFDEKEYYNKLDKLLHLFYTFNPERRFRDMQNNNVSTLEDMALYFASKPELINNPLLEAEKNVFLMHLNKKNLCNLSTEKLIFDVFKNEVISELELISVNFNREKQFEFNYRFYKSLNQFLQSKNINTPLISKSSRQEEFHYKKKFYQSYKWVCNIFIKQACINHNIAFLPENNKNDIKKEYRKQIKIQYRKLYAAQNWALLFFIIFSAILMGIITHNINIDHNFRLRFGKINRSVFNTENPIIETIPETQIAYPVYKVTSPIVNLRSGPGTHYKIIGSVKKNDLVTVKDISNYDWYKVEFNNKEAYIYTKFISKQ